MRDVLGKYAYTTIRVHVKRHINAEKQVTNVIIATTGDTENERNYRAPRIVSAWQKKLMPLIDVLLTLTP